MTTECAEAFLDYLDFVLHEGNIVTVREMKTREINSAYIYIEKPLYRCYFVKERNDNIFAKVAETLWMLAGRNDITWLSYYLPRVFEYSDDGKTWHGAYGPRLRNWHGHIDQLRNVVNKLNLDPLSRQAVISIFDPEQDYSPTKDVPCNNWLNFFIRDGKLNLNIAQRSCDILWGYSGIDTWSWSLLQQMMAYWNNSKVGNLTHFITSLHLYEQHWQRAEKILYADIVQGSRYEKYEIPTLKFSTNFGEIDDIIEHIFGIEASAREDPDQILLDWSLRCDDELMCAFAQMLVIYSMAYGKGMWGQHSLEDIGNAIMQMKPSDLRLAVIEYLTRKETTLFQYLTLEKFESSVLSQVYDRL